MLVYCMERTLTNLAASGLVGRKEMLGMLAIALSERKRPMGGGSWGSREGEGGVLMTVDRALSVGRWRGTGCPQQASLWRAMKVSGRALGREQTVPCVVTTRQADALQRNYL